jgi:intracellular proteinase inhibitor BsuPI
MRRPLVMMVLLTTLTGCGGDGGGSERQSGQQKDGLSLSVEFDTPLRSGGPVTWKLDVKNAGPGEVTLAFRSGKNGDVALMQGGREAYRWSGTKYFTQAMRQERLAAGDHKTFTLEDPALSAAPGDYELVAELDSEPAPPPARRSVKVEKA